ncbi:hypothetical protein Vadar_002072 [Vaccinium darrowii]|uniref:Uncharacterized protein n=1 Tax=Vaccinium darrowii TaxID=229202 RepID=A0ACB7X6Z8_9ERIC|nr:hypothetical protein Vadar_002072 [Vaccinium darrowii]
MLSTDTTRISDIIFNCEHLTLPEPGLDDGQMTPDSTLKRHRSFRSSSGGIGCTVTAEVVVGKKRSNVSSSSAGLLSRRKGTPQRSPLY